jgi:hypothetical protein
MTSASDGKFFHEYDGEVETIGLVAAGADRMIAGIASTPRISAHNDSLASKGCYAKLPIPLLCSHGFETGSRKMVSDDLKSLRIGEVVHLSKSPHSVFIRATIDHSRAGDATWRLIQDGTLKCLSVGTRNSKLQGCVEGVRYIDTWELEELSVCKTGANADCRFEIYTSHCVPMPEKSAPLVVRAVPSRGQGVVRVPPLSKKERDKLAFDLLIEGNRKFIEQHEARFGQ